MIDADRNAGLLIHCSWNGVVQTVYILGWIVKWFTAADAHGPVR